jgi:hypothetical protein
MNAIEFIRTQNQVDRAAVVFAGCDLLAWDFKNIKVEASLNHA